MGDYIYIVRQQEKFHELARKKKMQMMFVNRLKSNKVSKWKEIIEAEFGVVRPQSVFRIPRKNEFYMINEDAGSIGIYYKIKPVAFRINKKEQILEKHADSFLKLAELWDDRLEIKVTAFNIIKQYFQKELIRDDTKGYSTWKKMYPPVIKHHNSRGVPGILNKFLHLISFRIYFTTISNNAKNVRLYISESDWDADLYLPNIFKVPIGQWISLPLDGNKKIDIIKMKGKFETLPHPYGENFGDWRIVRAGALDERYPDFFLMQHKCKGKRTYSHVVPYLVEDLLKSKDPQVVVSCENDRECWDCGTIIKHEDCIRLITAQTLSSM